MTIKYLAANLLTGLSSDTKPTNIPTDSIFIETDTNGTNYIFDGTSWIPRETQPYTWLIYKQGSNYKAKNGFLGTVPTGAINTDMDTVWAWTKANFNQAGDQSTGGKVCFYNGQFVFTEALDLDENYGNSNNGIIVEGNRRGTVLRFEPAAPLDSAIILEKVSEATLRDFGIVTNNNVTNAIRMNATLHNLNSSLVDNIRIVNDDNNDGTPNVQAGQRGIYLVSDFDNPNQWSLHFNTIRNLWIRFMDLAAETQTLSTSNQNTSFLRFLNLDIWRCNNGIKIGDYGIQTIVDDVICQDTATPAMDYVVSLGKYVDYCMVNNITADKISKAGSAAVILNQGAKYNKIRGVTNTGIHAVFDYSGNMLNEITDCVGFGSPNLSNKNRLSTWDGASASETSEAHVLGSGLFAHPGSLFAISEGTGNSIDIDHFDNSDGKGVTFTTGATTNNQVGFRGTVYFTQRQHYPLLKARFKLGQTDTTQRFWLLLTSLKGVAPSSNAYDTTSQIIGLCYRATGSIFQIIHNEGAGTPAVTNCQWPDDSTIALETVRRAYDYPNDTTGSPTTQAHEFWLLGDPPNSRWLVCLDRGKVQAITGGDQPGSTTSLTIQAALQTTADAARSFSLYSLSLGSIR